MIAVRKVYQRAIVTPTHHVEQLWKDYENFENSVSRQLVNLSILLFLSSFSCSARNHLLEEKADDLVHIIQAKGLISEYQPKFNSARAVYRERKKYTDEIDLNILAVPPTGSSKVIFLLSEDS